MCCQTLKTGATLYWPKSSSSDGVATKPQKLITNCFMLMVSAIHAPLLIDTSR